ncbi:hypothetical protein FACS1894201_07790 [Bacteroidia bacterium]|nr:hypothetical protein FACS1894201_07790 [Bacteroidia bacterium]
MKKIIATIILVSCMLFVTSTQAQDRAIGLRGGNSNEVSFQQKLSDQNRIELDLGAWGLVSPVSMYLTGLYQWTIDIPSVTGLNWYVGVGVSTGLYAEIGKSSSFSLAATGQAGIEYNLIFPLQISLDYRPAIAVVPGVNFWEADIALSVRYRF